MTYWSTCDSLNPDDLFDVPVTPPPWWPFGVRVTPSTLMTYLMSLWPLRPDDLLEYLWPPQPWWPIWCTCDSSTLMTFLVYLWPPQPWSPTGVRVTPSTLMTYFVYLWPPQHWWPIGVRVTPSTLMTYLVYLWPLHPDDLFDLPVIPRPWWVRPSPSLLPSGGTLTRRVGQDPEKKGKIVVFLKQIRTNSKIFIKK